MLLFYRMTTDTYHDHDIILYKRDSIDDVYVFYPFYVWIMYGCNNYIEYLILLVSSAGLEVIVVMGNVEIERVKFWV